MNFNNNPFEKNEASIDNNLKIIEDGLTLRAINIRYIQKYF